MHSVELLILLLNLRSKLEPIMLKSLSIILSGISQKILSLILACCLLFPNYARLVSTLPYKDVTALLEYLNVLLEYINLLADFQLTRSHLSFSCASLSIFLAAQLFLLATQGET